MTNLYKVQSCKTYDAPSFEIIRYKENEMIIDIIINVSIAFVFMAVGKVLKRFVSEEIYNWYILFIYISLASMIRIYWLGM